MISASRKDDRLGYVGKIESIDVQPVLDLLSHDYIPVVSTVGCDGEGNVYNINADTVAAYLAGALRAENLITMTFILRSFPGSRPAFCLLHTTNPARGQGKFPVPSSNLKIFPDCFLRKFSVS